MCFLNIKDNTTRKQHTCTRKEEIDESFFINEFIRYGYNIIYSNDGRKEGKVSEALMVFTFFQFF